MIINKLSESVTFVLGRDEFELINISDIEILNQYDVSYLSINLSNTTIENKNKLQTLTISNYGLDIELDSFGLLDKKFNVIPDLGLITIEVVINSSSIILKVITESDTTYIVIGLDNDD